MSYSSYTLGRAQNDIDKLLASGEIKHENKLVGCCKRNYLTFPNDQHKYQYNPGKTVSEVLRKKLFRIYIKVT